MNLEIYTGIDAVFCKNIDEALTLSNQNSSFLKLILCAQKHIKDPEEFDRNMNARSKVLALVLGTHSGSSKNIQVIDNKFDMRNIIRKSATYLGVTAVSMASKEVPDFYPIKIELFKFLDIALCDVYMKTEDDFAKFLTKGETSHSDFDLLKENGNEYLYIQSTDRLAFVNKATIFLLEVLREEEISAPEALEITAQGMEIVADEIFMSDKISQEVAEISKVCVKAISNVSEKIPRAKKLMAMLLENKAGFIFSHSVLSTYIACSIIKNMDWGSKEQQEKVSFVLFFHDLYLVPIYNKYEEAIDEEDLVFREDVTDEDKEIIFDHAAMIGKYIQTFPKAPIGADSLATQHHGNIHGKGFPGIFNDDISPLAKVIVISEEVTKHILDSIHHKKRDIAFDKDFIKEKLSEKFTRHTYRKLIDAFMNVEL